MKILFVCLGNVARSQMAEAYYNHLTNSNNALSAGTSVFTPEEYGHPLKEVVQVMKEDGIDISQKKVKTITEEMIRDSDRIFVMCGKKACPGYLLDSDKIIFWDISDPFETSLDNFRKIRDEVKEYVLSIL